MKRIIGALLLAAVWAAMSESFSLANLALGFVLGFVILWFLGPMKRREARSGLSGKRTLPLGFGVKVWKAIQFLGFFIKELIVANLRIAYHVLTPHSSMSPAVIAVPLEPQSDLEVTLLANIITLTPGSFSLDVSSDRRVLYVHVIEAPDIDLLRAEIKRKYETRLLELLR